MWEYVNEGWIKGFMIKWFVRIIVIKILVFYCVLKFSEYK